MSQPQTGGKWREQACTGAQKRPFRPKRERLCGARYDRLFGASRGQAYGTSSAPSLGTPFGVVVLTIGKGHANRAAPKDASSAMKLGRGRTGWV